MKRPVLDPALTILTRSSGEVQVGWDPERAVLIRPPVGVATRSLAALLNHVDGTRSRAELAVTATSAGVGAAELDLMLGELAGVGLLTWTSPPGLAASSAVHVHGRGPLSDAICGAMAMSGICLTRSRDRVSVPREWPTVPALVVLADELVADPCLASDLAGSRIAHLAVRLRDGIGMVGPLVLPGRTSCLRCGDLHRADRDPEWPTLAAQLLGQVGHGSAAAVRATAGIALGQIEHLLRGHVAGEAPPRSLNATIEIDPRRAELHRRVWTPHHRCACGAHR
ncbi:MAG: hypothetical protein ACXVXN_02020 [Mycobacteriaceae bacterium]